MSKIKSIFAYEILDSRGFPTVACTVVTNKGNVGKAKVPSGASTGEREALELRDGDTKRFNGKGVLKAVSNINEIIAPKLIDQEFNVYDQEEIDNFMIKLDGTDFKKNLGANATLAVSLAVADAAAKDKEKPLYRYIKNNIVGDKSKEYVMPVPMLNVINGGAHADNTIDFQEFMIQPISANSIQEACRIASECFHSLAKLLKADGYNTSKGDEGGFAPKLKSAEEALEYMTKAVTAAGYVPGKDITFALDTACSELYEDGKYTFAKAVKAKFTTPSDGGNVKTTEQMITYLESLVAKFPILSIEDGLGENDREGWAKFMEKDGETLQIVGDDLYCTNPNIIADGIKNKWTNSVLIKLNQIGTLTETIKAIQMSQKNNWTAVVSHRSGETEDTFIADLCVALGTGQIKTGSMSRSDRIAKYNRLIEIEHELGSNATYKGRKSFYSIKEKI